MDFRSARPWGAPEERAKVPPAPPPPPEPPPPPKPKQREYWEEQEDNERLVRENTVLGYKRPLPHQLIKIVPEMTYFQFEGLDWSRSQHLPDFTRPKVERKPSDGDYLVVTSKGKLMFISGYEVAEYFSLEDWTS